MLHPTGAEARQSLIFDSNRATKSTEKTALAPGRVQAIVLQASQIIGQKINNPIFVC